MQGTAFVKSNIEQLAHWLKLPEQWEELFIISASLFALLFSSFLLYFITKFLSRSILASLFRKTHSRYDDIFINRRFLRRASYLIPLIFFYRTVQEAIPDYVGWIHFIENLTLILINFYTLISIFALLDALNETYTSFEENLAKPIKGYLQAIKIIAGFMVAIIIVSIVINKSPTYLIGGIGALSAVLILIFKDTILGFVASVQFSANKVLQPGDWITAPKHNADGTVTEISLSSVKVMNFDNTMVVIPTYLLMAESFQNWRSMQESQGRRIKRAVNIDLNSVKFCDHEMFDRLSQNPLISRYVESKSSEIIANKSSFGSLTEYLIEGKNQTNLGIFRAYLMEFLRNHPYISKEMTLMVRQLPPAENGLPIEIYAFSTEKDWEIYESIIADIFDHIIAVISYFDLAIYQKPSGSDKQSSKTSTV